MKTLFSYLFALCLTFVVLPGFAQDDVQVLTIACEKGQAVAVEGNVSDGREIPLQWAASSQIACFPATRFQEFKGNHIFYRVDLPRYSKITIRVEPQDGKRINLYGIRQGVNASMQAIPPYIQVASSCEADYPIYAGHTDMSKGGETQDIEFIAINNPYSILIAVAGAQDVTEGDFQLVVEIGDR